MKTKVTTVLKQTVVTTFLLFVIKTASCQENYQPGYILTLKYDTLRGFIDYRDKKANPDKILFKEKLTENSIAYTPLDSKGFGVLNDVYESATVGITVGPGNAKELYTRKELRTEVHNVFLQAIISGKKNLYSYLNGKDGRESFFIKADSSYELLIYNKYTKEKDGLNIVVEDKKYMGQLAFYLRNCAGIQSKLNNVKYETRSLEKLFLYYFNCIHSEINYGKKKDKVAIEPGLLAGVSLSTLHTSGITPFDYVLKANYKPSVDFTAGLFLDFILPRNQRKLSIYNEVILTSFKVNGRYDDYTNENQYAIIYTALGNTYLKMNNMLRYKYPIGKMFVYVNAGVSNGYAFSGTNYRRMESKFQSTLTVKEDRALADVRNYEQGYILGLGTKFRKYSFEMRYEDTNGFSAYTGLVTIMKRFYFLVGYRF